MHADTVAEDEEKWLAEGIAGVQQNAYYMHRALVSSNPNPNPNLYLIHALSMATDLIRLEQSPNKVLARRGD